ncbi:MAG: glutathione S-transferase family protein [Pseudomonadota bacterium]
MAKNHPYKVYGAKTSGAAMIEMALAEAKAPFERVSTRLGKGGKHTDRFFEKNPTGKLPALETPSGEVLTESAAILISLAERHRSARLLPDRNPQARASALRWLVYVASEIYPMIEIRDYPKRFVASDVERRVILDRSQQRIRRRWLNVEAAISGTPWLLPNGLSIADLSIATVSRWSVGKRWRRQHCPKIEALTSAVAARELAGPVWRYHFEE